MRALGATLRFTFDDKSGYLLAEQQTVCIFALWHNRIGVATIANHRHTHRTRVATLVSMSDDGEILAGIVRRFGMRPVRGSTSRRGPQSLLEMTRVVEDGYSAVITPDGPRGPREVVQPGLIGLAKVTGLPIVTVSCTVSNFWQAKSWDRFIVPKPFARCHIRTGEPILVPSDASPEMLATLRDRVQESLTRLMVS